VEGQSNPNDVGMTAEAASRREAEIRTVVRRQAEFYRHLIVYVLVIGLLWIINAVQYSRIDKAVPWYAWWALFPTLGWGIGVLMHGLYASNLPVFFSARWEEKKVRELLDRERDQRASS
jgi:hypothetical protein